MSSEVFRTDRCYVCHSTRIREFKDHDGFVHLVCADCRFVRLHPDYIVSGKQLYTNEYFDGRLLEQTNGKLGYTKCYADPTASYRIEHYRRYIDEMYRLNLDSQRRPLKILDFGCGYGAFLKTLMEGKGSDIEVHGIELNPEVCSKASESVSNASIYCADLKTERGVVPCHYFDVITMLDVLEHLDDPRQYLRSLAECANDTGYLLLSTTNIESLNARLYRDRWILHGAPYHTCYFGPCSLKILLEQCRWNLRGLHTERTIFHNERSGMETWRGKTARMLFQNRFCDVLTNKVLHLGSIMVVIAQRDLSDT